MYYIHMQQPVVRMFRTDHLGLDNPRQGSHPCKKQTDAPGLSTQRLAVALHGGQAVALHGGQAGSLYWVGRWGGFLTGMTHPIPCLVVCDVNCLHNICLPQQTAIFHHGTMEPWAKRNLFYFNSFHARFCHNNAKRRRTHYLFKLYCDIREAPSSCIPCVQSLWEDTLHLLGKQMVLPLSRNPSENCLRLVYGVGSSFAKQANFPPIIICHFLPQLLRSKIGTAYALGPQFNTKKIEKLYKDVWKAPLLFYGFSLCSIRHGTCSWIWVAGRFKAY